jgi:hypothetical protein
LKLLVAVAERAPTVFAPAVADDVSTLVSTALRHAIHTGPSTASQVQHPGNVIRILTDLVVATARAHESVHSDSDSSGTTLDPNTWSSQLGRTCLVPLLETIRHVHDRDVVSKLLQALTSAAEHVPALLAGSPHTLPILVTVLSDVAHDATDTDIDLQLQAVQVLASLVEHHNVKHHRLTPQLVQAILQGTNGKHGVVQLCLHAMVHGTDDDWDDEPLVWHQYSNDNASDETAAFAQELLHTVLQALGKLALDVVLPSVERLCSSPEPTAVRAGLAALQVAVQAAPVSIQPHLPVVGRAALTWAAPTHHSFRVQFQATQLAGVLCELPGDATVRTLYGPQLLQALAVATGSPCPHVAAVASTAIVSYCRGDGITEVDAAQFVVPYLADVLHALVHGPLSLSRTDRSQVVVVIRAVGAVACLAQASGPAFAPYYSHVVPGLWAISQDAATGNPELAHLRGAALEAATIIGQALGDTHRELFVADAVNMMDWAVPYLNSGATHVPLEQLLSACARVASVLGEDYAPYAGVVLPHLMQRATAAADMEVTEGDQAGWDATQRQQVVRDDEQGTESMTIAIPGRGLAKVTVNTTRIQEKAQAVRAIYEHAVALGAAFPQSEACLDAFLELVRFPYSAEIRAVSAQTLAAIYEASCAHGEDGGMRVPATYLPLIAQGIATQIYEQDEADMDALYAMADSLSEIYYSIYRRLAKFGPVLLEKFTVGTASATVQLFMQAMVACLERRRETADILSGSPQSPLGEDEHAEYAELLRLEETLLTPLVDAVGYTLKFLRHEFLPIFEAHVLPVLGPYLSTGNDIRARLATVCLFDDCVEYCGAAAAAKFAPMLMEGALLGMNDASNGQDEELLRAAIYGIAQIARYAPSSVLAPHAHSLVQHLATISSQPKDEADNVAIHENAVSTLASLVLIGNAPFRESAFVKPETALHIFLANLPLREDADEAKICHSGLCDLVERNTIDVTETCQELIRIIGEILVYVDDEEDLASPETLLRSVGILLRMQKEVHGDAMQRAFASIPDEAQAAINNAMQQHSRQFNCVVTP